MALYVPRFVWKTRTDAPLPNLTEHVRLRVDLFLVLLRHTFFGITTFMVARVDSEGSDGRGANAGRVVAGRTRGESGARVGRGELGTLLWEAKPRLASLVDVSGDRGGCLGSAGFNAGEGETGRDIVFNTVAAVGDLMGGAGCERLAKGSSSSQSDDCSTVTVGDFGSTVSVSIWGV